MTIKSVYHKVPCTTCKVVSGKRCVTPDGTYAGQCCTARKRLYYKRKELNIPFDEPPPPAAGANGQYFVVVCPYCGAARDKPCKSKTGKPVHNRIHRRRIGEYTIQMGKRSGQAFSTRTS